MKIKLSNQRHIDIHINSLNLINNGQKYLLKVNLASHCQQFRNLSLLLYHANNDRHPWNIALV